MFKCLVVLEVCFLLYNIWVTSLNRSGFPLTRTLTNIRLKYFFTCNNNNNGILNV